MNTESIVMCVVALILGMLMANMLKNVCGCKVVEGQISIECPDLDQVCPIGGEIQQEEIQKVNPDVTTRSIYVETPCAKCVQNNGQSCHENDGKNHCLTHQPSGTCNFSRIDNSVMLFNFNASMPRSHLKVFSVNYNVLRIMSGMGGLAYSN